MRFHARRFLTLWAVAIACTPLLGQDSATLPAFEVTSVKHADRAGGQSATEIERALSGKGRISLRCMPLGYLVSRVFDLPRTEITQPAWLATERFDIDAVAPPGTPKETVNLMFQRLLADRFGLKYHWEQKTEAVHALTLLPGATLPPGIPDDDPDTMGQFGKPTGKGTKESPFVSRTRSPIGVLGVTRVDGVSRFEFDNISMRDFARYLSPGASLVLGTPVIDGTGLPGRYHVWYATAQGDFVGGERAIRAQLEGGATSAPSDPPGTTLHDSLAKQGLRLVRKNAMVEHFVLDHIERTPTAN